MPATASIRDWRVWKDALVSIWTILDEKNLGLIAAGTGFFAMLALFPGLAALIAIWGLMADTVVIQNQLDLMRGILPPVVYELLYEQMAALMRARPETLGWATLVSILAAFWSARAGVAALMRGLNAIYHKPHRMGLRRILAALAMTGGLILMGLVALLAVVVAPVLMAVVPLGPFAEITLQLLRWVIAASVLIFGIGVIYRLGPNRRGERVPLITPGSILAVVLWVAVSLVFSAYLANFARYNEVYGSIGAAISMLMWFYLSAYVVLLGAVVNAELERRRGRRAERESAASSPAATEPGPGPRPDEDEDGNDEITRRYLEG